MRRERITVAAVPMHSLAGAIARADEQQMMNSRAGICVQW